MDVDGGLNGAAKDGIIEGNPLMTGYLMLQTPASFTPLMAPQQDAAPLSFVFHGGRLLVRETDLGLPDEADRKSVV